MLSHAIHRVERKQQEGYKHAAVDARWRFLRLTKVSTPAAVTVSASALWQATSCIDERQAQRAAVPLKALLRLPDIVALARLQVAPSADARKHLPTDREGCRQAFGRHLMKNVTLAVMGAAAERLRYLEDWCRIQACSPLTMLQPKPSAAPMRLAGELSAVVEFRRHFPLIQDGEIARSCVRSIAGWAPIAPKSDATPPGY